MTGRLWGDRRAEAFQNALDGHVDLTEHELSEFVQMAHALRDMPPATLGNEARDAMRARLVAEADSVLVESAAPAAPPRRRRRAVRTIAGSTAAAAALSAGLVAVSADALPGDMLYPIKRGVESLEITFGGGGATAGSSHLDQGSERLDEAMRLARSGGDANRISDTLRDFTSDTRLGTNQLLSVYASDDDAAAIDDIRSFTNASAEQLRVLAPMLGQSTDAAYTDAVEAVEAADRRAIEACPTCAGGPAIQVPYLVDPIGRLDTLPYNDHRDGDDSFGRDGDDIYADPQNLPHGTDIPPIDGDHDDNQNDGGTDDDDSSGPKLQEGSGSDNGSSSTDEPKVDPDEGNDNGNADLPDLPNLPDADDVIGGGVDLGPVEDVLGPVRSLLGPLGDLLLPVVDDDSKSDKNDKDKSKGPLDGLLGPVLGGDRDKKKGEAEAEPDKVQPEQDSTDETTPDESESDPDSGTDGGDDQGQQDGGDGPLDGLVGPVDETDDAPDVDQDEMDGLTDQDEGGATQQQ